MYFSTNGSSITSDSYYPNWIEFTMVECAEMYYGNRFECE